MEKIFEKTTSLLMIILIITTTVSISFMLNAEQVQAQAPEQEGCCLQTVPPSSGAANASKQCVTVTRDKCAGRFFTGPPFDCSNIPDCQPGTCIPKAKDEPCLRNKPLAECTALGGVPDSRALEEIPQCKIGCCIIAKGIKTEVLQYRQCENLTKALGYTPDMMDFRDNITSQIECKKIGAPSDLGCCVLGGGDCKYGAREGCTEGNFIPLQGGLFCRDVTACALTTHDHLDCGQLPGTEGDIYWFDSSNNQEELNESCNYPNNFCTKDISGKVKCKTTTCTINGSKGGQTMSDNPPKVERDTSFINGKEIITGTSLCYNFFTDYGDEVLTENRSTGLQNQIIHCSFGKREIEGLGADRQKLCVPTTRGSPHGYVKENNWQNCTQCGKGGAVDFLGDFFGPFPPIGRGLNSLLGNYCTREACEGTNETPSLYGDCVYKLKAAGLWVTAPVASCVPKYPPGTAALNNSATECGKCGNGISDIWNICSKEECSALGDCYFKGYTGELAYMIPILLISSFIVGRLVWLPIDCMFAGPTVYGELGGIGTCYKVRTGAWWFRIMAWPYKLFGLLNNPIAKVTAIVSIAALIKGFIK